MQPDQLVKRRIQTAHSCTRFLPPCIQSVEDNRNTRCSERWFFNIRVYLSYPRVAFNGFASGTCRFSEEKNIHSYNLWNRMKYCACMIKIEIRLDDVNGSRCVIIAQRRKSSRGEFFRSNVSFASIHRHSSRSSLIRRRHRRLEYRRLWPYTTHYRTEVTLTRIVRAGYR